MVSLKLRAKFKSLCKYSHVSGCGGIKPGDKIIHVRKGESFHPDCYSENEERKQGGFTVDDWNKRRESKLGKGRQTGYPVGWTDSKEAIIKNLSRDEVVSLGERDEWVVVANRYPRFFKLRQGSTKKVREFGITEFRTIFECVSPFLKGTGVLQNLGYRVGREGLTTWYRRKTLEKALSSPFEQLPQGENMDTWNSEAGSDSRKRKIIGTLEFFIRRSEDDSYMSLALDDWKSDLEWFQNKFSQ